MQVNKNAFAHIEIIRLYYELLTCVCWPCLYEVLNREIFYINRNFGQPVSSYTSRDSRRGLLWVMRNQLTDYELEQFLHALRDLLALSLEANLSFDSAKFSRRLDGFKRTLSVLSSSLRVCFPTQVQLLSDLNTLLHMSVNGGSVARTYLIWVFVWRGRGTTFNRRSGCCDIGLSRSPKAWHLRKSFGSTL